MCAVIWYFTGRTLAIYRMVGNFHWCKFLWFLFSLNAGRSNHDHTPTGWCDPFRPSLTGLLVFCTVGGWVFFTATIERADRQTVENHLVHMGTQRTHIMMSSISLLVHFFFHGFYFRRRKSVCKNRKNLHPAKMSRYIVTVQCHYLLTLAPTISLVILFFSCMCIHNKSSLSHLFCVSSVYQQFHSTIWELSTSHKSI